MGAKGAGKRRRARDTVMIVNTRIGCADIVPRGYELASCVECGAAVWTNPDFQATGRAKARPLVIVCEQCIGLAPNPPSATLPVSATGGKSSCTES